VVSGYAAARPWFLQMIADFFFWEPARWIIADAPVRKPGAPCRAPAHSSLRVSAKRHWDHACLENYIACVRTASKYTTCPCRGALTRDCFGWFVGKNSPTTQAKI
jgi:hypothetical protein